MIIVSYICRYLIDFYDDYRRYFQGSQIGTALLRRSPAGEAPPPGATLCFTPSFRTNRLQGRDHVVF
jgi:hypothetical protein